MRTRTFFSAAVFGLALQAGISAVTIQDVPKDKQSLAATSHKARQTRPIALGTSGGSVVDKVKNGCCSGTLGSLVKDKDGVLYILSNTHVLAGDSASGGNGKVSAKGDPVNQPGYIDINCQDNKSDYVANLDRWQAIVADGITPVDAAIAKIVPGMVDSSGSILEIGTISSTPVDAYVGQKVKKSGRTSGLTTGKVSALHATISVEYTDECGGKPYTSTFHDQILITPGSFIKGGDSGSLLVENVAKNPRPIGLLFAGSSQVAIANPIQTVLDTFGVSMVGVETTPVKSVSLAKIHPTLIAHAKDVKTKYASKLMRLDGVVGHAVGVSKDNPLTPAVLVLVESISNAFQALVPTQLDGVPVEVLEIGSVKAY